MKKYDARGRADELGSLPLLVGFVEQVLVRADIELQAARPDSMDAFGPWYLEALQALETTIAARTDQRPVLNREFSIMCRCAISAQTLREAISVVSEFSKMVHPRNGEQWLRVDEGDAIFYLDTHRPEQDMVANLVDITGLYTFFRLFQWLTATQFELEMLCLGPADRDTVLPFLRLFDAPAVARGDYYSLHFPSAVLDKPVVRHPSELPVFLATWPGQIFGSVNDGMAQRVSAIITAALAQSRQAPSLTQISATLLVPESTLRRKLASQRTSYRKIRQKCLMDFAQQLLVIGETSIEEISSRLGYSDTATFRKAFRSWTGASPSVWRSEHHESSQAGMRSA